MRITLALIIMVITLISCKRGASESENFKNKSTIKMEENKKLIRLWIEEGWNKNRNAEIVDQVFSKDWVTASPLPNQPKGTVGAMYWVNEYRKVFSDFHFEITHLIADTNYVSYRYEVTAVQTGEFMGIAPTNKKVKYSGIAFLQIVNGKIAKTWNEFDLFGLRAQLEATSK